MRALMIPAQLATVIKRWAALAPAVGQVTWAPVEAMVNAAEEYGRSCEGRLRELAGKYQELVAPLGDPLWVRMSWLERSHEPAYSRWLAWVLEQLGSPERVWRVLGVCEPPDQGAPISIKAECQASREDRLDIVVFSGAKQAVVVEVKLGYPQPDDLQFQLRRYRRWIRKWSAKGVVIVADAEQESYEGFAVRRWAEICVALRRVMLEVAQGKLRVVAAMMLAFVGAVEQNLLGFPSLDAGESPLLYPRVAEHLEASMEGIA
jgi:hypothetical protein